MNRRLFGFGLSGALGATASGAGAGAPSGPGQALDLAVLSRFNPLRRVLIYDDFDEGINGWAELQSNHSGNLDDLKPNMRDMRPAQLSSCTFFDIGTHGSMSGTYALKLATRPKPFHNAAAIKRVTFTKPGLVQLETWFTFKAEQTFGSAAAWDGNVSPSERDFGDFTISNDVCEGENGPRYIAALRYQNTDFEGRPVQKWMYKTSLHVTTKMAREKGLPQDRDFHVANVNDWAEVPGGRQPLCFNETATKINWHYLRWLFSIKDRRNVELQVNDLVMDLRGIQVLAYDQPYRALNHLLNLLVDVRTHRNVRNFLFLDSVLVSVDW
jgi:hypothetical protein